ncbi:ankyrin repeat domain-containing protein [Endozoicomonas atrinae]|uniref:ankyrin repeat domain-containing protein n=1 Tax=Endozoicomonas atrinae TaxID=1333660 RepID=UPI000826FC18|nr:ankyrin repeat domain-containing protein [Endozoicomonas atrinae]
MDSLPSSLANSPRTSPIPEAVASNTEVYSAGARVFLESNTFGAYVGAAKGVVQEALKNSVSELPAYSLPHELTLGHMACLAADASGLELLKRLVEIPELAKQLTQSCKAIPVEEIAVLDPKGDPVMPAINKDDALNFALFRGWKEGVEFIIKELTKDDNKLEATSNGTGNSPVNLAAGKCDLEVMVLLCASFDESAASDLKNRQTSPGGSTPLHSNVRTGMPEVCEWLLDNGAEKSISLKDKGGLTPYDHLKNRLQEQRMNAEEIVKWEKLLPRLDPKHQEVEIDLSQTMGALKV